MNIQQIQPVTFQSKARYIPQEMSYNLGKLLRKMDNDTLKTVKDDFWRTKEVRSLTIEGEGSVKRGKFLAKRNEYDELVPYGEHTTMLEMNKARLIVNNRTDEIIEYKKPFFMSWKKLFNKAGLLIIGALNNYHNVNIVKRKVVQREGLTENGAKKAEKELKPIFEFINEMAGKNG